MGLSSHPKSIRNREARTRRRNRLIQRLGGKCVQCESIVDLEFDHLYPRNWKSHALSSDRRLTIYEQEAGDGRLQLLCRSCNAKKGAPHDEEPF